MTPLVISLALLASTSAPPADAPVEEAVEVRTAVLELPDHNFITQGAGCFMPAGKCMSVARELAGLRQRVKLMEAESVTPWQVFLGFGVGLVLGLVGGIYGTIKACELLQVCR